MARVWIGTSGWHYKHWRGLFYPRGLSPQKWLEYYVRRYSTVEINASFYRQQPARNWELWRETAPPGFLFSVKASRFLTHIRRLAEPAGPLDRFLKSAGTLEDKLGPLLYQLPPTFHRTEENVSRLDAFLEMLPRDRMHVVEFRHSSWFGEDTKRQLRRRSVAFCAFDRPGFDSPMVATANFAYMRFHGTEERYEGNYTDEMLEDWSQKLSVLGQGVDRLFVYFNNDSHGFAIANATRLSELLRVPLAASP